MGIIEFILALIGGVVVIKIIYDVLLKWKIESKDNPHHLPTDFDIKAMKQAEDGSFIEKNEQIKLKNKSICRVDLPR
ncbi:hypothetical protein KKG15_01375 [Patescibacteria group bacterium]|nr:hypothetical protein [Patescibacteria group bacterium]